MPETSPHVAVIGGGFTGLAAAIRLLKAGCRVTLFEADAGLGGLAGGFDIGTGQVLERFYHHWFTNDRHVVDLVKEIGREGR
ncbi:FAD-dependent oxidoreductase [Methylobacterium oryzae CBMB20]